MKQKVFGKVNAVLLGDFPETHITRPVSQVEVDFTGFIGDHHSGLTINSGDRTPYYPIGTKIRNYRQVTILSKEEIAETREELGLIELLPEWYGGNLELEGIPKLTRIPPSTRLFFSSGAVLVVDGVNSPCNTIGKTIQQHYPGIKGLQAKFISNAKLRRGIVCWVEKCGFITIGDEVEGLIPE
jgi:hypothetical protein